MVQGRVLVPIRAITEALGSRVEWDAQNQRVLVNSPYPEPGNDSPGIKLWIYNAEVKPDAPPLLSDGRVLVPLRWVAESLGITVNWDEKNRLVELLFNGQNLVDRLAMEKRTDWNFLDPPGWTALSGSADPAAEKALQEVIDTFRQAQIIDAPRPDGDHSASFRFSTQAQWGNISGASAEVYQTGRYARLEVYEHPEMSFNLWFPGNELTTAVEHLKDSLPPSFPGETIILKKEEARLKDALPVHITQNDLPQGEVCSLSHMGDPFSGKWISVVRLSSQDNGKYGVYQSEDNGSHWQELALTGLQQPVTALSVSPADPGLWLATAGDASIYRSADAGFTWKQVWSYPLPESAFKYPPYQYLFDQVNPAAIYALTIQDTRHSSDPGILASCDSGLTWQFRGVNNEPQLEIKAGSLAQAANNLYVSGTIIRKTEGVPSYIWGAPEGGLLQTADSGLNWVFLPLSGKLAGTGLVNANQTPVLVTSENRIACGQGIHLEYAVHCEDDGRSWTAYQLPFNSVYQQVSDPKSSRLLAGVMSKGVSQLLLSPDLGKTWQSLDITNFKPELFNGAVFTPQGRIILMGVHRLTLLDFE